MGEILAFIRGLESALHALGIILERAMEEEEAKKKKLTQDDETPEYRTVDE